MVCAVCIATGVNAPESIWKFKPSLRTFEVEDDEGNKCAIDEGTIFIDIAKPLFVVGKNTINAVTRSPDYAHIC